MNARSEDDIGAVSFLGARAHIVATMPQPIRPTFTMLVRAMSAADEAAGMSAPASAVARAELNFTVLLSLVWCSRRSPVARHIGSRPCRGEARTSTAAREIMD